MTRLEYDMSLSKVFHILHFLQCRDSFASDHTKPTHGILDCLIWKSESRPMLVLNSRPYG